MFGASLDFHNFVIVSLAVKSFSTIVLCCEGYISKLIPIKAIAGVRGNRFPVRFAINDESAFQKLSTFLQFHRL